MPKKKKSKKLTIILIIVLVISIVLGIGAGILIWISLRKKSLSAQTGNTQTVIPAPILNLNKFPTKLGVQRLLPTELHPAIGKELFLSGNGLVLSLTYRSSQSIFTIETYKRSDSASNWIFVTSIDIDTGLSAIEETELQSIFDIAFSEDGLTAVLLVRFFDYPYTVICKLQNSVWKIEDYLNPQIFFFEDHYSSICISKNGKTIYMSHCLVGDEFTTINTFKKIGDEWVIYKVQDIQLNFSYMMVNALQNRIFFSNRNTSNHGISIFRISSSGVLSYDIMLPNIVGFNDITNKQCFTIDRSGTILISLVRESSSDANIGIFQLTVNGWAQTSSILLPEIDVSSQNPSNNIICKLSDIGSTLAISIPDLMFAQSQYTGKILIFTKNSSGPLTYKRQGDLWEKDTELPLFLGSYSRGKTIFLSGDGGTLVTSDPDCFYNIGTVTIISYISTYL